MKYLDTAFLAKLYLNEAGSEVVRRRFGKETCLACSGHGRVELAFVFHRKLREKAISATDLNTLMDQVNLDTERGMIKWLSPDPALLASAADSVRSIPAGIYLRAADAIHLLCARENGFKTIHSNDRHLLSAARYFGIRGINVTSDRKNH